MAPSCRYGGPTRGLHVSMVIDGLARGLHVSMVIDGPTRGLHVSMVIDGPTRGLHVSMVIDGPARGLHVSMLIDGPTSWTPSASLSTAERVSWYTLKGLNQGHPGSARSTSMTRTSCPGQNDARCAQGSVSARESFLIPTTSGPTASKTYGRAD